MVTPSHRAVKPAAVMQPRQYRATRREFELKCGSDFVDSASCDSTTTPSPRHPCFLGLHDKHDLLVRSYSLAGRHQAYRTADIVPPTDHARTDVDRRKLDQYQLNNSAHSGLDRLAGTRR